MATKISHKVYKYTLFRKYSSIFFGVGGPSLILSPSSHHLQIVRETCCLSLIDRRAKLNLIRLSANLQQIYNVDSTLKMSLHSCILLCNGLVSFSSRSQFLILQFCTCICFNFLKISIFNFADLYLRN